MSSDKLHERQRDPDERVRQEVVSTVCDAASEHISVISDQVLQDTNKSFLLSLSCTLQRLPHPAFIESSLVTIVQGLHE